MRRPLLCLTAATLLACGTERTTGADGAGDAGLPDEGGDGTVDGGEAGSGNAEGEGGGSAEAGMRLDVEGGFDVQDGIDACEVGDAMDAIGACDAKAPPDSFDPDIQWQWLGDDAFNDSIITPLVANLTDDNGDGEINLCDTPDVLIVGREIAQEAHYYILNGETGALQLTIDRRLSSRITPAIGDIDNDGDPEIVGASPGGPTIGADSTIMAFEADGTLMWQTDRIWDHDSGGAIALADMDNDGQVEIIADDLILDPQGNVKVTVPDQMGWELVNNNHHAIPAVADLDGDGDLELVLGQSAYHHDGTAYYQNLGMPPGFPQVANLDADPEPEILINNSDGLNMLEHDGTVKYTGLQPITDNQWRWFRPSTVHDFDGDGQAEFAASSANTYTVYEGDGTVVWSATVRDFSGWAAGTAFDFLGDGTAEAMYADEQAMFVFDDTGTAILDIPRTSPTMTEYPIVADIDNDGSSEIVIVSTTRNEGDPTVLAIRDVEDRWIQSRRIWNQHTYHVTNVNEDGSIPRNEKPHWEHLNTYRTNAQIEGGKVCQPDPVG